MYGYPDLTADNWSGVFKYPDYIKLDSPVAFANPIQMQTAEDAYTSVLEGAGAILPKRDAVDARVVNDVKNGTGMHINSQNEVGGYLKFQSAASTMEDDDHDGIPNEWEVQHGLNPKDLVDSSLVTADGYANLEVYLNSIAGNGSNNPLVLITAPANNAIIESGSNVTIEASATESDGSISKVEFYANGQKIGEDDSYPYSLEWSHVADGTYFVIAKAIDNTGTSTESDNVAIHANTTGDIVLWSSSDIGLLSGVPM